MADIHFIEADGGEAGAEGVVGSDAVDENNDGSSQAESPAAPEPGMYTDSL